MREIVYKNLTGINSGKRDLCIREVVTKDDFVVTVERRCIYFVREKIYIEDPSNVETLEFLKGTNEGWKKRHFHIFRHHDSHTGEEKVICKVAGTLYAIVGHYVFCIAFIHSFKIELHAVSIR